MERRTTALRNVRFILVIDLHVHIWVSVHIKGLLGGHSIDDSDSNTYCDNGANGYNKILCHTIKINIKLHTPLVHYLTGVIGGLIHITKDTDVLSKMIHIYSSC